MMMRYRWILATALLCLCPPTVGEAQDVPIRATSQEGSIQYLVNMWRARGSREWVVATTGAFANGALLGAQGAAARAGDTAFFEQLDRCFGGWSMQAFGEFFLRDWESRPEVWADDWRVSIVLHLAESADNNCRE